MPDYRGISPEVDDGADLGSTTQRWRKLYANVIDPGAHIPGAFNKKVTFTTSGTFVAPVTGTYRITLQGGGGGGGGAGKPGDYHTGGGGGSGATLQFYESLTAGNSYAYTIGAGGGGGEGRAAASGISGNNGAQSQIIVNNNTYIAGGGGAGYGTSNNNGMRGGNGGNGTINGTQATFGSPGCAGSFFTTVGFSVCGGAGGGGGGGNTGAGIFGGGGAGGSLNYDSGTTTPQNGHAGGDGFISFEYYDPTLI